MNTELGERYGPHPPILQAVTAAAAARIQVAALSGTRIIAPRLGASAAPLSGGGLSPRPLWQAICPPLPSPRPGM
ncbi:hypothetical protein SKAU_G00257050 [Synaphobranchus kaupii]|uniref:Uncharacterized protein n=1 Tax=Synaphobranchus kaupii TaxID=118154 RepID=A0A9Q1F4B4_SYNKA|nr:hypothetical protein SKAU_G00257050 [Synaphobranchus kaupii]